MIMPPGPAARPSESAATTESDQDSDRPLSPVLQGTVTGDVPRPGQRHSWKLCHELNRNVTILYVTIFTKLQNCNTVIM
jgi:hypothetical protein